MELLGLCFQLSIGRVGEMIREYWILGDNEYASRLNVVSYAET